MYDSHPPQAGSSGHKGRHGDMAIILTDYVPPDEGSDIRQPVPLAAMGGHLERMHLNENCGFGEEYRVIMCRGAMAG